VVLVVGEKDHQRRIGIPFLDLLHPRVVGERGADLPPGRDGAEGADLALNLALHGDHVRVLFGGQFDVWLAGEPALPLARNERQRQLEFARLGDRVLVIPELEVLRIVRDRARGVAEPRQQVMPLRDQPHLVSRPPAGHVIGAVVPAGPAASQRQRPAGGIVVWTCGFGSDFSGHRQSGILCGLRTGRGAGKSADPRDDRYRRNDFLFEN
jgi:hypothetical protein